MVLGAERLRAPTARNGAPLAWWVAPSASLLWRLPLLAAIAVLSLWFAFRGLVHMAFVFDASPLVTFLLAPVLLPAAALPALCFLYLLRYLPGVWRDRTVPYRHQVIRTALSLPAALLLALFVDLLETVVLLRLGIRLPRLPFELL